MSQRRRLTANGFHKWRAARIQYLAVALVALAVFLPWIEGYFLSDDWRLLARNSQITGDYIARTFLTLQEGRWYRPLYELSIAGSWRLFGLSPAGHHLVGLILHAVNAALVAVIGAHLARDRRVGIMAGILFAVLAPHADAVLWIAGRNELLAALFSLSSLAAYIKFRDSHNPILWVMALLAYIAALMAKETALLLPLFFGIYDFIFFFPRQQQHIRHIKIRQTIPAVSIAFVGLLYLLIRLQTGVGYDIELNLLLLPKNLIYYLLMESVALPVSISFLQRFPIINPMIVVVLVGAVGACILLAGRQLLRSRVIWYGILWMVLILLPVLPIVSERSVYISTVGWVWAAAGGMVLAWDAAAKYGSSIMRGMALVVIAIILGANLVSLTHRGYWWNRTADLSQDTFAQIQEVLMSIPPDEESQLWLFHLPGQYEYAHAFDNAFPFAASLLYADLNTRTTIHAFTDSDSRTATPEQIQQLLLEHEVERKTAIILVWNGDKLVKSDDDFIDKSATPQHK